MSELLTKRPDPRRRLRELLREPPVLAPGVYDAMSARLVEQAGFPALYMSGLGLTALLLGLPDIGLLTMTDMVGAARRIVSAVAIPVIADADTGYGNAINVIRTVEEYEASGVAAIHLEDQVTPKRCGHMAGKQVVPIEVMTDRIAAPQKTENGHKAANQRLHNALRDGPGELDIHCDDDQTVRVRHDLSSRQVDILFAGGSIPWKRHQLDQADS